MQSMTTLYRAIVMIATGVIVVKSWQLYGPSAEQVKAGALRALEIAEGALNKSEQPAVATGNLVADPRDNALVFGAADTAAATARQATAPPLIAGEPKMSSPPALESTNASSTEPAKLSMIPSEKMPQLAAADADRLPALLSRLEGLGAAEPELATWGSSGELYRFCCSAPVGDSAGLERHFESVAAEPLVAVEEVVAKVEAWRTAQRSDRILR